MTQCEVSIVIVHKDHYELLQSCLRSVFESSAGLFFEVIVVDNCSKDSSLERVKTEFPTVKAIPSQTNLGFARAGNLGSNIACGKHLLFLNDDTLLGNSAIAMMIDFVERHRELRIGVAGALLIDKDGNSTHSFGQFPSVLRQVSIFLENLGIGNWEERQKKRAKDLRRTWFSVDYVTGAAMLIPRKVFEEMGGFDEDFFMYFEDAYLQFRMQEAGYRRCVITGPTVVHLGGGGRERTNKTRMNTYRSMLLYYRKSRSTWGFLLFCVFFLQMVLLHAVNPSFTMKENLGFIGSSIRLLSGCRLSGAVRLCHPHNRSRKEGEDQAELVEFGSSPPGSSLKSRLPEEGPTR